MQAIHRGLLLLLGTELMSVSNASQLDRLRKALRGVCACLCVLFRVGQFRIFAQFVAHISSPEASYICRVLRIEHGIGQPYCYCVLVVRHSVLAPAPLLFSLPPSLFSSLLASIPCLGRYYRPRLPSNSNSDLMCTQSAKHEMDQALGSIPM